MNTGPLIATGAALALLAACTATTPAPILSRADQDDLGRIAAYLDGMPRFQARFDQSGAFGTGAGLVWVDRPGHLRIDYQGPGARVMVIANGRVRILDRSNGATTTMPVSRTPLGILLDVPLRLDGPVTVDALHHDPGHTAVTLSLSRTGQLSQGTLTLDLAEHPMRLQAVTVTDAYHRSLTMSLSAINPSPTLTPELFQPPARPAG